MTKIIGVDMDGVLCDTMAQLCILAQQQFGVSMTKDMITEWDIWNTTPITKEQCLQLFDEGNVFAEAEPLLYAKQALEYFNHDDISHRGWWIEVVTDRPGKHIALTSKWLFDNKMPWHVLILKSAREKPIYAVSQKIDIFVEDRLSTAIALSKVVDTVFLLDSPWNKSVQLTNNVIRVKSWQQIQQMMEK
jgi:uncharacterized HAD superfamily protein